MRRWFAHISGHGSGTSLFERRPFGRLTGGHWTGYAIWIFVIPAAVFLLFDQSPGGWLIGTIPIAAGVIIAIFLKVTGQRHSATAASVRRPDWVPPDGHLRPYGGHMTSPAGILILAAILWLFVTRVPHAVPFLLVSVVLGILIGVTLWLRHR